MAIKRTSLWLLVTLTLVGCLGDNKIDVSQPKQQEQITDKEVESEDNQAPTLTIISAREQWYVKDKTVILSGKVTDDKNIASVSVGVHEAELIRSNEGKEANWRISLPLTQIENTFIVTVTDESGNTAQSSQTVNYIGGDSQLLIYSQSDGTYLAANYNDGGYKLDYSIDPLSGDKKLLDYKTKISGQIIAATPEKELLSFTNSDKMLTIYKSDLSTEVERTVSSVKFEHDVAVSNYFTSKFGENYFFYLYSYKSDDPSFFKLFSYSLTDDSLSSLDITFDVEYSHYYLSQLIETDNGYFAIIRVPTNSVDKSIFGTISESGHFTSLFTFERNVQLGTDELSGFSFDNSIIDYSHGERGRVLFWGWSSERENNTYAIYEFDVATHEVSKVTDASFAYYKLGSGFIDPNNNQLVFLVRDGEHPYLSLSLEDNSVSPVTVLGVGEGPALSNPTTLAIADGKAYGTDLDTFLWEVDLDTGARMKVHLEPAFGGRRYSNVIYDSESETFTWMALAPESDPYFSEWYDFVFISLNIRTGVLIREPYTFWADEYTGGLDYGVLGKVEGSDQLYLAYGGVIYHLSEEGFSLVRTVPDVTALYISPFNNDVFISLEDQVLKTDLSFDVLSDYAPVCKAYEWGVESGDAISFQSISYFDFVNPSGKILADSDIGTFVINDETCIFYSKAEESMHYLGEVDEDHVYTYHNNSIAITNLKTQLEVVISR